MTIVGRDSCGDYSTVKTASLRRMNWGWVEVEILYQDG